MKFLKNWRKKPRPGGIKTVDIEFEIELNFHPKNKVTLKYNSKNSPSSQHF